MQGDSRAELDKLTVKELRRQAALKNVPLQQIAVAVEKADLINLIVRAGPVLDTYDAKIGVKVHSASSIAAAELSKSRKPVKQKKKKRRHSSSSSSSNSSSSTRSRSRGRRKKRSRSRRRSRSKERRKPPALPARARSRSPSLTVITPLPAAARLRAARALPPPGAAPPAAAGGKASKPKPLPIADAAVDLEEDAVIPASTTEPPPPDKQHQDKESAIVQAGVAAAAAMGFKLTKAPAKALAAPALGLRPTVNAGARAAGPLADSLLPGGVRVCVEYLTTASCVLGDNCPDAHIIDPEEEMRVRAKFKEQECHSGALCNRPGCLFRHPGERLEKCILATESSSMSLRISGGTVRMDYR